MTIEAHALCAVLHAERRVTVRVRACAVILLITRLITRARYALMPSYAALLMLRGCLSCFSVAVAAVMPPSAPRLLARWLLLSSDVTFCFSRGA